MHVQSAAQMWFTAEQSLADAMAVTAARHPDARLVVSDGERSGPYRLNEVHAAGLRFGAHLSRLGIKPGDCVAVQLPASVEWLITTIGVVHAGAVLLPIVPGRAEADTSFMLKESRARLIVSVRHDPNRSRDASLQQIVIVDAPEGTIPWEAMFAPIAATPSEPRSPDDLAMLIYTSGTVAGPKGVKHSGRSLLEELLALASVRDDQAGALSLNAWPPGHVAGALSMLRFAVLAAPMVMMDRWDPAQAAWLIEQYGVTTCSFTPLHLAELIDAVEREGRSLATLRQCLVGAASVPPTLIDRCATHGVRTFRCYGSSEHPTITIGHPDDPLEKRLTTEGRPMRGVEIRFVDEDGLDVPAGEEGEIAVRGPDQFIGYHDERLNEEAFLPGGWFRTGDIGRLDPDGYLIVTDRKKDVIIRGWHHIASRDVEEHLRAHPDVAEVAVVGALDRGVMEVVCAFVVPKPGRTTTLAAIQAHFAAARMPEHMVPERLVLMTELPRNQAGKVLKADLRQRVRGVAL